MGVFGPFMSSPLLAGLAGVGGTAAAGIVVQKYRERQQAKADAAKWYQDAVGFIARVQKAGYRTTTHQHQVNYPKLQEKLEPLADDIQEHAGSAPVRVDEDARVELAYIAAFCSGILNLTEQESELEPAEFFRAVQQHARNHYSGEHDMEDVNQLLDGFDAYELVDDLPDDVEVNEEKLEKFASHFNEESLEEGHFTTIDEALNMPLAGIEDVFEDEQAMQDLLGDTMEDYVRLILVDYTEEIYKRMDARKAAAS